MHAGFIRGLAGYQHRCADDAMEAAAKRGSLRIGRQALRESIFVDVHERRLAVELEEPRHHLDVAAYRSLQAFQMRLASGERLAAMGAVGRDNQISAYSLGHFVSPS